MSRRYGSSSSPSSFHVAPIYRQRLVRIGDHCAVAGKMFGGGGHAGVLHARHVGERELRHDLGLRMEGAIADDLAHAESRSTQGANDRSTPCARSSAAMSQPMARANARPCFGIDVEFVADAPRRRQRREAGAETLDAPALLVHGDDQRG